MASSAPVNAVAGQPAAAAAQQDKEGRATLLGAGSPDRHPVDAPSPLFPVLPDPDDSALQWDCGMIMHGLGLGINGKLERRHSGVRNIPLIQCSGTAIVSCHGTVMRVMTQHPGALIRDFFLGRDHN